LKKAAAIILLVCLVAALAACGAPQEVSREIFAMDTLMTLKAWGSGAGGALDSALDEIRRLDALLDNTDPASDISRINAVAGGQPVTVVQDTMDILSDAVKYGDLTSGALDVTVSPLVKAWAITTDTPRIPSDGEIASLLPLVDYRGIRLDPAAYAAGLALPGSALDMGALGKGFASKRLMALLRQKGVASAIFSLGGNVGVMGGKTDGSLWRVGIRDPEGTANDYVGYVSLKDGFVITSGDYERFFIRDGVRYHHIFDPAAGKPARTGLRSVTIIAQDGTLADALSTALFVMGQEKALAFYGAHRDLGFEAVFITEKNHVIATPGAAAMFTFTGEKQGYSYEALKGVS
jgi:FAD:protein FMN transferase